MALEIVRELVGNVWRTRVATGGGSGGGVPDGGTTGEVLTKASNADQDTEWAAGGGSTPETVVRFPFAFDTSGIAAGVPFYTPAADDIILAYVLSLPVTFDGTSPALWVGTAAGLAIDAPFINLALDDTDNDIGDGTTFSIAWGLQAAAGDCLRLSTAAPLVAKVVVLSGPAPTAGEGELVLLVAPAA